MSSPNTIVIVGGTRGIGLELVKQAVALYPNATIYATARDPTNAPGLQTFAGDHKNIHIIAADAKDGHSIQLAAERVAATSSSIDHLIYNAGVLTGWGSVLDAGIDNLKENIDTNLYGAYFAALYFTPLLLKSQYKNKSLVFLSSSFASMALADDISRTHIQQFGTENFDPTGQYNISKTALNRLGRELDTTLRPQGLPIVLIHPGLVKTDMNPYGEIETSGSVSGMLKVITSPNAPPFVDWEGKALPW